MSHRWDVPFEVETWSNGLRVLWIERPGVDTVFFRLHLANGTWDETRATAEFTHAGEHLWARFTDTHHRRPLEVGHRLGELGVESNASTGLWDTDYWIAGLHEHQHELASTLARVLYDFWTPNDWAKQKAIVKEELRNTGNDVWRTFEETARSILYPAGHPAAFTCEERLASLERATLANVKSFCARKIHPAQCVLTVEGTNLDRAAVRRLFDRPVAAPARGPEITWSLAQHAWPTGRHAVKGGRGPSCRIQYWFRVKSIDRAAEEACLDVMMMCFCVGYHSRLFHLLREEHGLIYGLRAGYDLASRPDLDWSTLSWSMEVAPANEARVSKIVEHEVERFCRQGPTALDLRRVKNQIKMVQAAHLADESYRKFDNRYARYVLEGRPVITFGAYFRAVGRVTADDVKRCARAVLREPVVVVGRSEK